MMPLKKGAKMYRHLSSMLVCLLFASFVFSACSFVDAPSPSPTIAPSQTALPVTFTPEATATKTPRPSPTPRPSRTPDLQATAQYDDMAAKVKEYFEAGYISTEKGAGFKKLPSFTDQWAQIGWYQWTYTDYSPSDFVLETDLRWSSASSTPDSSGCGFVFRLTDEDNFYVMYVSLKGFVRPYIVSNGNQSPLSRGYYGSAAQNGGVHLTLIAEKDVFHVLIDGKFIESYYAFKDKLLSGKLAYTVFSGTNKDFGTRCTFSQTSLWLIKK